MKNKIIKFIELNGWATSELCDDFTTYTKGDNIGIDVSDKEIVLIDGSGDFMHIEMNNQSYYTLLGALISNRCIAMDFKETP